MVFKEKRLSDIWTFIPLASLKFLILSLWVDFGHVCEPVTYEQLRNLDYLQ